MSTTTSIANTPHEPIAPEAETQTIITPVVAPKLAGSASSEPPMPLIDWQLYAVVFVGGCLGTGLRYGLGLIFPNPLANAGFFSAFHVSTFTANMCACFIYAWLSMLLAQSMWIDKRTRSLVSHGIGMGMCGGFSTLSALVVEELLAMRGGDLLGAMAYGLLSFACGLAVTFAGVMVALRMTAKRKAFEVNEAVRRQSTVEEADAAAEAFLAAHPADADAGGADSAGSGAGAGSGTGSGAGFGERSAAGADADAEERADADADSDADALVDLPTTEMPMVARAAAAATSVASPMVKPAGKGLPMAFAPVRDAADASGASRDDASVDAPADAPADAPDEVSAERSAEESAGLAAEASDEPLSASTQIAALDVLAQTTAPPEMAIGAQIAVGDETAKRFAVPTLSALPLPDAASASDAATDAATESEPAAAERAADPTESGEPEAETVQMLKVSRMRKAAVAASSVAAAPADDAASASASADAGAAPAESAETGESSEPAESAELVESAEPAAAPEPPAPVVIPQVVDDADSDAPSFGRLVLEVNQTHGDAERSDHDRSDHDEEAAR